MIAKNEEKNIGKCLTHLKAIVDEQIVIDTGSTDNTVEIARNSGAKIYDLKWENDFSAARNFAISKAKGDWIIFLDCDEYFTDESIKNIKKCINESGNMNNIDGIIAEMINIDDKGNIISILSNISARIFKNKKSIKYKNKIHEHLINLRRANNDTSGMNLLDRSQTLKIIHTGYAEGAVAEKNKSDRNIVLLKEEIELHPNDAQLYSYLGESLCLGNSVELKEEAIQAFLKALDCIKPTQNYTEGLKQRCYSNILNIMLNANYTIERSKEIFEAAIIEDPEFPDFYYFRACKLLHSNQIDEAEKNYIICIDKCDKFTMKCECKVINLIENIYKYLLQIYTIKDNRVKAVEICIALLKTDQYDYSTLSCLIEVLLKQEKEENIINFLAKIYDYNLLKDKIYLIKASEKSKNQFMIKFYKNQIKPEEEKMIENSDILKELFNKDIYSQSDIKSTFTLE